MEIRNQGSAGMLFEKVQSLRERAQSWRCIYINLSSKRGVYSPHLVKNFFIKPTTDLLENSEGTIYCCEDGDIFILFQGALSPVVNKLNSHFGDLQAKESPEQHQDNMFSVFDLGRHWNSFYKLCEDKHHAAEYLLAGKQFRKYPGEQILRSFNEMARS